MKNFLHPLWLIMITCTICQGQIFLSPMLDLTQQVTIKRATARAFLNLSVGFEHNKNTFLAGPVIRIAQFDQVNPKPAFISGIQYTYRYSFTNEVKKLRFFGEVMSKYQKIEDEWISNYWSAVRNKYIDYEVESEETIWENSQGNCI